MGCPTRWLPQEDTPTPRGDAQNFEWNTYQGMKGPMGLLLHTLRRFGLTLDQNWGLHVGLGVECVLN
eukprot:5179508-Alexandrium_andersonii.AAC.1